MLGLLLAFLAVACGGETTEQTVETTDSETTTSSVPDTTATSTAGDDDSSTTTTAGDDGGAAIEVNVSALPTDPTGFDSWSADICSLFTPEQLDAFFGGVGEIALSEGGGEDCRWAVEGFPRSHYVDVDLVADETDTIFLIVEDASVNDLGVAIGHGPLDIIGVVPTPDGRFLRVLIHGAFEVPSGPQEHFLDPALIAFIENVTSRY
jgi:hypothetical protein